MKCLITGGAGFIGSHIADHLLSRGDEVVIYDNFSTGQRRFIAGAVAHPRCRVVEGDILDASRLTAALDGCDMVFHLAANADVRFGLEHPRRDLEQNTIGTFSVLESMRSAGVTRIAFSSTGSVYGEAAVFPTPEDAPMPVQTSLYGASKLAGEALITAYAEGFGFRAWIFRFVSILGPRYSHGHIFDFYRRLREDSSALRVLGNGRQRKSYLHVDDCVRAIFTAIERADGRVNLFNLGTDEYCQVNDSIGWIAGRLGLSPALEYTGTERGWVGDNPFIFLDCSRIRALGWAPSWSIRDGVVDTLEYLMEQTWLLDARG